MMTSEQLRNLFGYNYGYGMRSHMLFRSAGKPVITDKHRHELFFMLDHHDRFYEYSEDSNFYSNGTAEKSLIIKKIQKTLHLDYHSALEFYRKYYSRLP